MGGWVGRSVGGLGVNSDAVGQVCNDIGLHQLAEELLLLGDVVRPRLREGDKSKVESAACDPTQLRALTLEFTQACSAARLGRPRHLQPRPDAGGTRGEELWAHVSQHSRFKILVYWE